VTHPEQPGWSPWAARPATPGARVGAPLPAAPTGSSPSSGGETPGGPGRPFNAAPPGLGAAAIPSKPPLAETDQGLGGVLLPPAPPATYPSPHALPAPAPGPGKRSQALGLVPLVLIAALVGALTAGGLVWALGGSKSTRAVAGRRLDIHRLLTCSQPSVVSIETGATTGVFGGAGSGFVVDRNGLIITNNHVIDGSDNIQVHFFDGTQAKATLVGSFPDSDIAMIKTSGRHDLSPAHLGTSSALQVGDDVVAIGNALNLGGRPSVTLGIVSAKDRSISSGPVQLDNLIQTDAAINPGNSGGPLVNQNCEVVGINTAIVKDAQNVGFSISIDSVKPLIAQLKAGKGTINPANATLGVTVLDVTDPEVKPEDLHKYGVTAGQGAFITTVLPGSAAGGAGLTQGDVITEIDGQPVTNAGDVGTAIRSHRPGDKVSVTFEHAGQRQTVTATLTRRGG